MYALEKKYNALAALGITVWQPRVSHPQLPVQSTIIDIETGKLHARCMVVQYFATQDQSNLGSVERKIFDGMLSVLNLSSEQIMLVNVSSSTADLTQVIAIINQWQPETVLQLNMDIEALDLTIPYQRTYSPVALARDPSYKPQAYKDLLTLRNILHHGTSQRLT